MRKHIILELGETFTVPAGKDKPEGSRFHVTGGAAVVDSAGGDVEEARSLKLVAAQVGRTQVSFGPDLGETLTDQQKLQGAGVTRSSHDVYDIEVVPVGARGKAPESAVENPAAKVIPVDEVQEGPSEKTPYGMDQENKPVVPHGSMTAGDKETSPAVAKAEEPEGSAEGAKAPKEAVVSESGGAGKGKGK